MNAAERRAQGRAMAILYQRLQERASTPTSNAPRATIFNGDFILRPRQSPHQVGKAIFKKGGQGVFPPTGFAGFFFGGVFFSGTGQNPRLFPGHL